MTSDDNKHHNEAAWELHMDRKLTEDEVLEMQRILKDVLLSNNQSSEEGMNEEDAADFLAYCAVMVSNAKSVNYVVQELESLIADDTTVHALGEQLYNYLSSVIEAENPTETASNDNDAAAVNSNEEATAATTSEGGTTTKSPAKNALAMSGALGASRGSKTNNNKTTTTAAKGTPPTTAGRSGNRGGGNRGGGSDGRNTRQAQAFDRLTGRGEQQQKQERQQSARPDSARGGGRGRTGERGGRDGGRGGSGRLDNGRGGRGGRGGNNRDDRRDGYPPKDDEYRQNRHGSDSSHRQDVSSDRRSGDRSGGGGRGYGDRDDDRRRSDSDYRRDDRVGGRQHSGRGGDTGHGSGETWTRDSEQNGRGRQHRDHDSQQNPRFNDRRMDERESGGRGGGNRDRDGGGRGGHNDDRHSGRGRFAPSDDRTQGFGGHGRGGGRRESDGWTQERPSSRTPNRNSNAEEDFMAAPSPRSGYDTGGGDRKRRADFDGPGRDGRGPRGQFHGRGDESQRGGRGGRGRDREDPKRMRTDAGYDEGYDNSNQGYYDESSYNHNEQSYYDEGHGYGGGYDQSSYNYPPRGGWRGGYRGGGRAFRGGRGGRGFPTPSDGNSGVEGNTEGMQTGDNSTSSAAVAAHPSPLVAATFHGRGYGYRGGGAFGRGRGRAPDVKTLIASKTWVRKKPEDETGGGGDDGGKTGGTGDGGDANEGAME